MSNTIIGCKPPFCNIHFHGDQNVISFGSCCQFKGNIYVGYADSPAIGCKISIGSGVTCTGSVEICVCDDNTTLSIGDDCMFSFGNFIWTSDTHAIIQDSQLLNRGYSVIIGNHVWIGMNAIILKNTQIPSNSIIGACAVVSGKYDQIGSVFVGNPAKVTKTGINWDRARPTQWLKANYLTN